MSKSNLYKKNNGRTKKQIFSTKKITVTIRQTPMKKEDKSKTKRIY